MYNVGIIGNGFVGKATSLLSCEKINLLIYDINPLLCNPLGTTITDLLICNVIFICVPTPMKSDGSCYIDILRSVLNNLHELSYIGYIICRSTVPVGTCDELNCYFMPEFLTEVNYINDFINNPQWIIGVNNSSSETFQKTITNIIQTAYDCNVIKSNDIIFVNNKEAEMIKLFRNCYLATKVSFCNEISDFCKVKGINYDIMSSIACSDSRIGLSHSKVPGPDGKHGFGGTCFPKDTASLLYQMKQIKLPSPIINSVVTRNNTIDRPENDWNENKGRAVI